MKKAEDMTIEDFDLTNHLEWQIINDGVMGGMSQGRFKINPDQTADFWGEVSLENNGGFTSVRASTKELVRGDFQKIRLRINGDGKYYSFRLRPDVNFDGIAYACTFATKEGEWTELEFSPEDFNPTFRGRTMSDAPPLKDLKISQIGFLISNKQSGTFKLTIDWIRLA